MVPKKLDCLALRSARIDENASSDRFPIEHAFEVASLYELRTGHDRRFYYHLGLQLTIMQLETRAGVKKANPCPPPAGPQSSQGRPGPPRPTPPWTRCRDQTLHTLSAGQHM